MCKHRTGRVTLHVLIELEQQGELDAGEAAGARKRKVNNWPVLDASPGSRTHQSPKPWSMKYVCRSNSEPFSLKDTIIPLIFNDSLPIKVFPVKATTESSLRLNQWCSTETRNYKKMIRLCFHFSEQNLLHLKHHYRVLVTHSSMRIWVTGGSMPSSYNILFFTFWFGYTFSLAKEIASVWRKRGRDLTHLMAIYKGCKAFIIVVNELTNYRWPLNCGSTQRRNPVKLVQFYFTDLLCWPNHVPNHVDVNTE